MTVVQFCKTFSGKLKRYLYDTTFCSSVNGTFRNTFLSHLQFSENRIIQAMIYRTLTLYFYDRRRTLFIAIAFPLVIAYRFRNMYKTHCWIGETMGSHAAPFRITDHLNLFNNLTVVHEIFVEKMRRCVENSIKCRILLSWRDFRKCYDSIEVYISYKTYLFSGVALCTMQNVFPHRSVKK